MKPELNLLVDEFTLVLQPNHIDFELNQWTSIALEMIKEFEVKSRISEIFGNRMKLDRCPQGYKIAFKYGNHSFYFAVAFHEKHVRMGIIVKFSALSWKFFQKFYQDKFDNSIEVYQLLSDIRSDNLYNIRLSRFDLAIDYINYDFSVDDLYTALTANPRKLLIKNANNRINNSAISGILTNNIINSIYIGSRKRNVNLLLRIYNKKLEQIVSNGYYLANAIECKSWIRFEIVFKGIYAHQITEKLYGINTNNIFKEYLINLFLEKYQFYQIKNNELIIHPISKDLFTALKLDSINKTLFSPRPTNNEITSSLLYIIKGSGLFPLLYKIEYIWGEEQIDILFSFMYHLYKTRFTPSIDHINWLEKNTDSLMNISLEELLPLVTKLIDRGD